MPRIDPTQLLKTLNVLLAPHGGIKSSEEVSRLVQLMQKFSKKLVSKIIYVKILKSSSSELLDRFLNEKGWDLLNYWFADAIKTNNWPLCAELTQLFQQCPMTAQRLKENVDQNLAPKLIRQLSCDVRVDTTVRQIAIQVLNKWMAVVQTPAEGGSASLRTTRGMRNVIITSTLAQSAINTQKVQVTVHTSTEDIINLGSMTVSSGIQASQSENTVTTDVMTNSDGHAWVGKGRSFRGPQSASRSIAMARKQGAPPPGRSKAIIESDDDSDDEYKPSSDPFDAILSNGAPKSEKTKAVSATNGFGVIRNESLDVDDLLNGNSDDDQPIKLLQGLANELTETLKKEVVNEIKKEDKDIKRNSDKLKEKEKRRDDRKDKDRHKDKYKDKHREKDRDKERERRKEEERRRRDRDRERQKDKERKEKKRESKPYRETEMRDGLDSSEKQRIRELAQKMRAETQNKKEDFKPVSTAGFARIPKIPKKEEEKKEVKKVLAKKGPSFEDLIFAIDTTSSKTVKAPPIKNKNKDLLESISSSMSAKPTPKSSSDNKIKSGLSKDEKTDYLLQMRTEDKSKQIVRNDSGSNLPKQEEKNQDDKKSEEKKPQDKRFEDTKNSEKKTEAKKEEEKKTLKRPSTDDFKIKIKSSAQLVESPLFGDFLSTIMPEAPKKKKIKLSDLKAQKEAKAAAENIMTQESEEEKEAAPFFSFYRDTMEDEDGAKKSQEVGNASPESETAADQPKSPSQEKDETNKEVEMPFVEPESDLPREVRGILVYAKGPKRTRRIQWKTDDQLVEIEYFELDETERVNVNKLKFEEQKKREAEYEKTAMHKKPGNNEINDNRQWPNITGMVLSCELPEIDYGGNSNEKKEQQQRENTVLQALFFNNKLPSDPIEPDAAGGGKGESKLIPLEDISGEEDLNDYSAMGWPEPIHDPFMIKETSPPGPQELINNIQPNILQNIIGGGSVNGTGNTAMDAALYAAQKAAEDTLRKQGMLPSKLVNEDPINIPMDQNMPPPGVAPFGGQMGPEMMEYENFPQGPQEFPSHPNDMDFYPPMEGNWRGGAPHRGGPPLHGGPPQRNGPPVGDFNRGGGGRGFPPMGPRGPMGPIPPRGFPPMNKHNGGFIERQRDNFKGFNDNRNHHHNNHNGHNNRREDNRRDQNHGKKDFRRPCKFWIEQGFCREEGRCKFPHPAR